MTTNAELQPTAPATAAAGASRMLAVPVVAAVAIAFADSSIVVLALPDLYSRLGTTIVGIAWVVTAYNAAVAATALVLVVLVHRFRSVRVLGVGLVVFLAASIACALSSGLAELVAARSVQGIGAALLLVGALPALGALTGSPLRGTVAWTLAGTFGAALGPALGGVLTGAFDWRAIFVVQAPVAALALAAVASAHVRAIGGEGRTGRLARTLPANLCLGLVFGALVGALFLGVLLVITVWGHSPIVGAAIVSVLPAAALAAHRIERLLPPLQAVCGGAALLALGLAALALLPAATVAYACPAFALCGIGIGLAVPPLSACALDPGAGLTRGGTLTVGIRHLGLVAALASVAPLIASTLPAAGDRAESKATAVILDSPIGLAQKVPIALDLDRAFGRARQGELPDLAAPFDRRGAGHDPRLAAVRDELGGSIRGTLTRAFRPAFALCAGLAGVAAAAALLFRRRVFA